MRMTQQGHGRPDGWPEVSAVPQCDLRQIQVTGSVLFSFIPCRRKGVEDTNVFTLSRVIEPFGDLKAVNFLERKKYPRLA